VFFLALIFEHIKQSTKVHREGVLEMRVSTLGGLTQSWHDRTVLLMPGKVVIRKMDMKIPSFSICLYGLKIVHFEGFREFDVVKDDGVLSFRAASAKVSFG
jgi:hypothetical protein